MSTPIDVRLAVPSDADNLAALFAEDYAFYGLPVPEMDELSAHIRRDVIGGATVMVAHQGDAMAGFAIAAVLYPAPQGSGQMYMKELFISEAFRSAGVGKLLMKALARHAVDIGCSRLDWTAETTNQQAIDYYRHMGAAMLEEKRYFRLDGETLSNFADET